MDEIVAITQPESTVTVYTTMMPVVGEERALRPRDGYRLAPRKGRRGRRCGSMLDELDSALPQVVVE
ncbi:MAG: hypothetical protein GF331_24535 [Chitinivibrionales bacterium]|nr:hypothetical protein [Chitinivibrionales bacterium]